MGFSGEGPVCCPSATLQVLGLKTRATPQSPWQGHVAGGWTCRFAVNERDSDETRESLESPKGCSVLDWLRASRLSSPEPPVFHCVAWNQLGGGPWVMMVAEGWLIPDAGIPVQSFCSPAWGSGTAKQNLQGGGQEDEGRSQLQGARCRTLSHHLCVGTTQGAVSCPGPPEGV